MFLAVVFSLQNGLAYVGAGQDPQWKLLFLGELPGWLAWVVLAPLIAFTVKKLPFRGPAKWWHVVALAALGVLIVAFRLVLTYVIAFPIVGDLFTLSFTEYVGSRFQRSFIILYMVYAGFVLVFQLIEYNTESRRRERHMRGLESSLLEARLNMLRTQLQPHFLFNTMNSIAAMINSDPDGARSMVHRLSALLRTSLDETAGHTISLNEEIALLREYLEIQQIRFADRFSYSIEIPPGLHHEEVPRFLLQPIVENAIKFSAQIPGEPIHLILKATKTGAHLQFCVLDQGPGFSEFPVVEGLGLQITRQRLEAIYPDMHTLEFSNRVEGGALVLIQLETTSDQTKTG